jgi:hypothetical protein
VQALPVQSEDGSTFHAARESKPCAKAQLYQPVLAVVAEAATAYVDWLLFLASGFTADGLSFLQQTFQKGESFAAVKAFAGAMDIARRWTTWVRENSQ